MIDLKPAAGPCRALLKSLVLGLLFCMPWVAGAGESQLSVTATVVEHFSFKVLAQPASVVVTGTDIERGYVDAGTPSQVDIQSNSRGGYLFSFVSQGDFIRQVLVKGLGQDVQVGAGGMVTRAAGAGTRRTTLDLGFRFILSDSAREGIYPWPMQLSVTPL